MTKALTAALALTLVLGAAAPSFASDNMKITDEVQQQIRAKLTGEGYEVRKIDSEDGMIEVYALKDGQKLELYLDEKLNVVRTKTDD